MNDAAKSMRYLGVLSGVSYVSGIDYFKTINQRVGSLRRPVARVVRVDLMVTDRLLIFGSHSALAHIRMRNEL